MGERGHALEEVALGLDHADRLEDDGGDPAGVLGKDALERAEVVVREGSSQLAHGRGHPAAARGCTDVPVLPAVVTAARDHVTPGVRARGSHGARRGIRAVLAEADHLRARHDLRKRLGHLDLERMGERERDAIGELLLYRRDHVGIVVAQDDRAERHHVVDVLVAVHVPHVAPPPALEEDRRYPLDELSVALAERLRARGDDLAGTGEVLP